MGGTRAPGAWEEPGFSTGTDAQRRLPVFAGVNDWQAEPLNRETSAVVQAGETPSLSTAGFVYGVRRTRFPAHAAR